MILCVGRNYRNHAKELQNPIPTEPILFTKESFTLRDFNDSGVFHHGGDSIHFEAEMVFEVRSDFPAGKTLELSDIEFIRPGLDLTLRSVQSELKKKGLPWFKAKSFKGSTILGPRIEVRSGFDPQNIEFTFTLNGVERQRGHTKEQIFDLSTLLDACNKFTEWHPADLIFTGTPEGVGEIALKDSFSFEVRAQGETYTFSGVI